MKYLTTLLIIAAAVLSLGASTKPDHAFVAHAQTLTPRAVVVPTIQPTVQPQVAKTTPTASRTITVTPVPVQPNSTGLLGRLGYARPGGNCVDAVGHRQNGNPSSWRVLSRTPSLGAAALWGNINHVGLVVGIWPNGDLEIVHFNWNGSNQHRFPASTFRGYS